MKKILWGVLVLLLLTGCAVSKEEKQEPEQPKEETTEETAVSDQERNMYLTIGNEWIEVNWEDNEAVSSLKEKVDEEGELTVDLSMYGGFEQVGSLGFSLPRNDRQTVTECGDIVLYNGSNIVLFYGSNSWSYTKLGKMTGISDEKITELLSNGDVTIEICADHR